MLWPLTYNIPQFHCGLVVYFLCQLFGSMVISFYSLPKFDDHELSTDIKSISYEIVLKWIYHTGLINIGLSNGSVSSWAIRSPSTWLPWATKQCLMAIGFSVSGCPNAKLRITIFFKYHTYFSACCITRTICLRKGNRNSVVRLFVRQQHFFKVLLWPASGNKFLRSQTPHWVTILKYGISVSLCYPSFPWLRCHFNWGIHSMYTCTFL